MPIKDFRKLGVLNANKTIFLMSDIQEIFRKHVLHFSQLVLVANKMITAARHFEIPMYAAEQYPKGLGHTAVDINVGKCDLTISKTQFSMMTPELRSRINTDVPDLQTAVLFGLETHICIEQTAIDLLKEDVIVHVLADGVSSRSSMDRRLGLTRLAKIGCFVTTSENVLFKLLGDKNHPAFKRVAKLVKKPTVDTLK